MLKIKALVYDAKSNISLNEYPKPQLELGEALIKVKRAGICGSDMVAWNGGFKRIKRPVILGHEFTGEIVEILDEGDDKKFKIGDRVVVEPILSCGHCEACRKGNYNVCRNLGVIGLDTDGGFASYVKVPIYRLHSIPESLTYDKAALCEPVAVAIHMVRRTGLKIGNKVAILGAGPIGLLVAMVARKAGAERIILSDINEYRLKMASDMGFKVLNANTDIKGDIMEYLGEEGADVCFELAASVDTLNLAIEITKIRGCILSGGIFKSLPPIYLQGTTLKEQEIMGSRLYTYDDVDSAIQLLLEDSFKAEKLISKKISINEIIEEGFEAIKQGDDVMKVLIDFK